MEKPKDNMNYISDKEVVNLSDEEFNELFVILAKDCRFYSDQSRKIMEEVLVNG